MLGDYIEKKLKTAHYKLLDDRTYFGEVPSVRGVWANAKTLETCREKLREVLEEWVLLKVRDRETIPGFTLKIDRRDLVSR